MVMKAADQFEYGQYILMVSPLCRNLLQANFMRDMNTGRVAVKV